MLFAQEAVKRENESMIVIEPHLIKYLCGGGGEWRWFWCLVTNNVPSISGEKTKYNHFTYFFKLRLNRNTYKITTV